MANEDAKWRNAERAQATEFAVKTLAYMPATNDTELVARAKAIDQWILEGEFEVTEEMIARGVHTLTGFNLDPSSDPISWPDIVRDVYLSMAKG